MTTVEIKDVEIPEQMQRAMARQAEAERERRAKIINSEGEYQAAEKLTQAADIISRNPASLQLRYLQTLLEISGNQNSTVIFPLPMDLISAFQANMKDLPSVVGRSDNPANPGYVKPEVGAGDNAESAEPDPATDPGYKKPRLEDIEKDLGDE